MKRRRSLKNRRPHMARKQIVLIVTCSVAAHKAALLASSLTVRGCDVHAVLTEAAQRFVRPLLFQSLTGQRAYGGLWEGETSWDVLHISLAERADLVVAAPATAHLIARYATGLASDLAASVLLATQAPVLMAPAMNDRMYAHPAVQENITRLKAWGVRFVDPEEGRLACGRAGQGRLADPVRIEAAAMALLEGREGKGS